MVRGRLPKESNPAPGQSGAGFAASFDTTGNEDYERVSPGNELPTKDVDVKTELALIKQTQQQILTRLDSPIDTQVTGSNVEREDALNVTTNTKMEEIILFDNVSLEAGEDLRSSNIEVRGASFIMFAINITVENWFARTTTAPFSLGSRFPYTIYPYQTTQKGLPNGIFENSGVPYICLAVFPISNENLRDQITTFSEALTIANKFDNSFSIWNNDNETATVTAKAYRVY